MKYFLLFALISLYPTLSLSQETGTVKGQVKSNGFPVEFVSIGIPGTSFTASSDLNGYFILKQVPEGTQAIHFSVVGYKKHSEKIDVKPGAEIYMEIDLKENPAELNEVVVTGTLKETYTTLSPIKVEVFTPKFFNKSKAATLFENLNMVNGVQPQLNCGVCHTGDIHMNGMEGPYTFILIDGMPIVSSLSTVYGFSGIPASLIQRVEIVKGPSSTLYGSEAVAGVINIITKNHENTPLVHIDAFGTTHYEKNVDAAFKFGSKRIQNILSVNYYNADKAIDNNKEGFTDFPLINRVSVFNKINFLRKNDRIANIAFRYYTEDRFGGQTGWTKEFRGSNILYGESIYTNRYELIGNYQLPLNKENFKLQYSYNYHHQNSYYGITPFNALQHVGFASLLWDKKIHEKHDLLAGISSRYTLYDDNTPVTLTRSVTFLPGIFVQNEYHMNEKTNLLAGIRYDYHKAHGNILSPRLSVKYQPDHKNTFRLSGGNGFRVVNLFTEEHAALTGAREVVIKEALKPETSYNSTFSYNRFISLEKGFVMLDAAAFYTFFFNKIIPDYETDINKIIYGNINGYAVSKGFSLTGEIQFEFPLKINLGASFLDVFEKEKDAANKWVKNMQDFSPAFSGTYLASYTFSLKKIKYSLDYSGRLMGPMHLPHYPEPYSRPSKSDWYSIHNIQLTADINQNFQVYTGIKNMLNYVQPSPLIDPEHPFGDYFDTSYLYGPVQGTRFLLGMRYQFDKKSF